jgi:type VII secretion integral membrane protein EccD
VDSRIPGDRKLAIFSVIRPKGSLLPASDTGQCRICVHCGTAAVDLALPAGIPVAVLIPSIVDILKVRDPDDQAMRYRLSLPGATAMDPSTTLAQNRIEDGALLVLSRLGTPARAPHYFDVAEAMSATLGAATPPCGQAPHRRAFQLTGALAAVSLTGVGGLVLVWNAFSANAAREVGVTAAVLASAGSLALGLAVIAHRCYRESTGGLALSVIAIAFAAVAGFVAVPGPPTISNVLLAAAAAAATSVLAMRAAGCGEVTLTAVSCVALVIAGAALAGVVAAAPLHVIGSASALASLLLLSLATRASIALTGLSPRLPSTPEAPHTEPSGAWVSQQTIRADRWLTSLLAGLSSSATVGAVVTVVAGAPRLSCTAFGAVTSALLLLRSRTNDRRRMLAFLVGGSVIAATTFGAAAVRTPMHGPWVAAATAMLAAASLYLGFVAPAQALSPVAGRGVDVLERLALVAMVPLTCWICGLYGVVRGLNLT